MIAKITLIDGTVVTVKCCAYNTWHGDEITLYVNENAIPQVCYKFPDYLVKECEISRADGAIMYLDKAVNDKYINGSINENGQRVKHVNTIWNLKKIQEYLHNAEKFGIQIDRNDRFEIKL